LQSFKQIAGIATKAALPVNPVLSARARSVTSSSAVRQAPGVGIAQHLRVAALRCKAK